MKLFKIALPILLIATACGGGEDDSDPDAILCPVSPVSVPVTVTDINGDALPGEPTVTISTINPNNPDGMDPNQPITVETDCAGSGSSWTCEAYPGDAANQVNAQYFPGYQPTSVQADVDGADCESVTVEIRMQAQQN